MTRLDKPRTLETRVAEIALHLATTALVLLLMTSAGCGEPGLSVEEVRARGFLRAGYSEEPPYAFVDSSGRVTGESPNALSAAAAAVGIEEVRWVRLEFRNLIPALEQGRVDVVAAGMYVTADRERRVRFSDPTACSGPALLVRAGDRRFRDILGVRDSASARVAALPGSVEQAALHHLGVPAERMVLTPDVQTSLVAVEKGEADAFAITAPTAQWVATKVGGTSLDVLPYSAPQDVAHLLGACSALAFRPIDARLATSLDSALATVLRSPERRHLIREYGFADPFHGGVRERAGKR